MSVSQVEADIRPFRGMLLGLFFVSTGGSLDVHDGSTGGTVVTARLPAVRAG